MQNPTHLPEKSDAVAELLASIEDKLAQLGKNGAPSETIAELQRIVHEIRSAIRAESS